MAKKKVKKPAKKILASVEPPVEEVIEEVEEPVEEVKEESKKETKEEKKEVKAEKKEFVYKYKEPSKMFYAVTRAGKYVPINPNRTVVVNDASELGTSKMKTLA